MPPKRKRAAPKAEKVIQEPSSSVSYKKFQPFISI